jgi:hypothetical protein
VVQDVWYFLEKAGIAELLGAEARTTQAIATVAAKAKRLRSILRLFITMIPPR